MLTYTHPNLIILLCTTMWLLFKSIHRAFKLDEDSALLTYVRQQLLPPIPSLTRTSPLSVAQSSLEEMPYQRNVRKVVHKISCTTSLLKLLVEVGSKVIEFTVVLYSEHLSQDCPIKEKIGLNSVLLIG